MRLVPLLSVLLAVACERHPAPPAPSPSAGASEARPLASPPSAGAAGEEGFELRLSPGGGAGGADEGAAPVSAAEARPLDDAALDRLLARLEPLPAAAPTEVALRPASTPPPRTGETVAQPFPAPDAGPAPEAPPAGPLAVLRWQPDGDVPLAPLVSVTFDRSMVPLASQAQAAASVPVVLDPQPAGAWRWVGTRTLVFDPAGPRMPMATTYTISVPASAHAVDGSSLPAPFLATFRTPPPSLVGHAPSGGATTSLSPVVVLRFDQAVDDHAIADVVEISVAGRRVPVDLAGPSAIEADEEARAIARDAPPERLVALVPRAPLPPGAEVEVRLPAGTPSAEGPRRTASPTTFAFSTHGPLALASSRCGWSDPPCRPGWPLALAFTNPLDADVDLDVLVQVEPPIPDRVVSLQGSEVVVRGLTAPRTRYRVTVGAGLRDVFGQSLAAPASATFDVADAEPSAPAVWAPGGEVQIPDPFVPPRVGIAIQGLERVRVRVARVAPEHWGTAFSEERWRTAEPGPLPGQLLLDEVRTVPGDRDTLRLLDLDLAPYTHDGLGELLVDVATVAGTPKEKARSARVWIDATHLGLSVIADAGEAWVVATDLRTGAALADVEVTLGGTALGRTDARGTLHVGALPGGDHPPPLVAHLGDDTAVLSAGQSIGPWGRWRPDAGGVGTAWFVFDDRGLYRPKETVHVKGWLRRVDLREGGDLLPPSADRPSGVAWTLRDAQGVELGKGTAPVDPFGGFAVDLALPATPNLGPAWLNLEAGGAATAHSFRIEEFRRPEFEVGTAVETAGPHVLGDDVIVATKASYYAGGGLPGAEVAWEVTAARATWDPPGWDGFHFGEVTPWWWERPWRPTPQPRWTASGTTDASGVDRLRIEPIAARPPVAHTLTVQATVQDVNRQAWTSSASLLVHPADVDVGVRTARGYVEAGADLVVDLVVTDLEGRAAAGREVSVELVRMRPVWRRGAWTEERAEAHACTVTSASAPVACTFRPERGGRFELTAIVRDARGRASRTSTPVWVSGGEDVARSEGVEEQQVTLVPDRDRYEPGEIAEVLVQAPFAASTGVVTWRRAGVVHEETLRLDGPSTVVKVPIEAGFTPALRVDVKLFGTAPRGGRGGEAPRPAWATGSLRLPVPPGFRALDVAVTPAVRAAAPGEDTQVTVAVTGADERPVAGAQVAIVAVDEAVLALSGHRIDDPLDVFHPERDPGTSDHDNRPWIRLALPPITGGEGALGAAEGEALDGLSIRGGGPHALRMQKSMAVPMAAAAAPTPPEAPIAVRADFRADALWLPAVLTGPDGRVTVPLDLPDSLTRYRITAVAVDADRRFGRGEADLTVRLPLMVRPSQPRFLNLGDAAELPVVLQNQTDRALVVDVGVRAANATVDGRDRGGRRATVPANDRVEVRLPVGPVRPGTATFQVAAAAGPLADAATFALPVWTPATTEAFATTTSLDGPKGTLVLRQPLRAPADALPQVGGLEVTTSTTALQALTDAVLQLVHYPYECTEQVASRVIAIAALRDVLDAFAAEGLPSPEALRASVAADVALLARLQNPDGSWGFWRAGERGDPMATLHVVHALVRAEANGFEVPADTLRRGLARAADLDPLFDRWWSPEARRVAKTYAVMVRGLAGQDVRDRAAALWREAGGAEHLPLEAIGWLLPHLPEADRAAALAFLGNRVSETASTAQWTTSYGEVDAAVLLHGDHRTDAVLLDAMLQVAPQGDLLPKVAAGLLAHRVRGAWSTTQENAWVLLALRRYFDTLEATPPELVAKVWVDGASAGEHAFRGRTTERAHVEVPMSWLAAHPSGDVVVAREGAGRLYVRTALRYAPASLRLDAAEHGFTVERRYEPIDDPADVARDPDGTWRVRPGARVRVTVTMVAPAQRYHVALVDPLPAGLEALNPALATTGDLPPAPADDAAAKGWWWGPWYDHENLRDERVEAFARYLPAGVWTYRYVARATTPGRYVVPPPKAEEMYAPETFGRGGTDVLVVGR